MALQDLTPMFVQDLTPMFLNGSSSVPFISALESFNSASSDQLQRRYDFYSNIKVVWDQYGNPTRGRYVDVIQDEKKVMVTWNAGFSDNARAVGVSADEALRKTDFDVYQRAIDAAFSTPNVVGIRIEGAWRPSAQNYQLVKGHAPGYSAKSSHISSRGLDISGLDVLDANGHVSLVRINNGGYQMIDGKWFPRNSPPDVVRQYLANVFQGGAGLREAFDPWRMWKANTYNHPNRPHVLGKGNDFAHRNHLHFYKP